MAQEDYIIWWPTVCGNESKQDAFWDTSISVNTDSPDLTRCFCNTALTWACCVLLWLPGPAYLYYLLHQPPAAGVGWRAKSLLNRLKMALSLLLVAVSLIMFFTVVHRGLHWSGKTPDKYIATAFDVATFALSVALIHLEHQRGVTSSGLLLLFWTAELITGIIVVRSTARTARAQGGFEDPLFVSLIYMKFICVCIQWILSFFADKARSLTHGSRRMSEKTPLLGKINEPDSGLERSPEEDCNYVSDMMYIWFIKLLYKGFKKYLTFDDLYDLLEKDKARSIVPKFLKEWFSQKPQFGKDAKTKNQATVFKAIVWSLGKALLIGAFYRLFTVFLIFCNPLLLRTLLQYIESGDPYVWKGYVYAFGFLLVLIGHTIPVQRFLYHSYIFGLQTRTAITAAVYRKALRLSSAAKRQTTVGEIVNLMSVDVQKLQDLPPYLSALWTIPILATITTVLLWQTVGPSCLIGIAILALLVPLNGVYVGNKTRVLQQAQMIQKDQRIRVMSEVLAGIKVLKLYGWEPSFQARVEGFREQELVTLKWANVLNAVSAISWNLAPYLVTMAIFALYTQLSPDNVLTADKVFVTMSLVNTLQFPLVLLPYAVSFAGQGVVALRRIQKFLLLEEVEEGIVEYDGTAENAIKIEYGNFSWDKEDECTLQNIHLSVKPGSLVAVVGQVGAGKSSLVAAVLGEMWRKTGSIVINGSLAYVPQQAWIQNKTVKDNILFDKPYDKVKYERVLAHCALKTDLEILSDGDMTEIGEKGINLSGGQKQRVSLARAVYQDEDIYLLDDPLSAVDSHVGRQLFRDVIGPEGVLRGKTRILVTHGITFLPSVDVIVVMSGGKVSEIGSYDELMKNDGAFADFLRNYLAEVASSDSEHDDEQIQKLKKQISVISEKSGSEHSVSVGNARPRKRKTTSTYKTQVSERSRRETEKTRRDTEHSGTPKKLIEEETAKTGSVTWDTLYRFMIACGRSAVLVTVIFYIVYLVFLIYGNIWLSEWTADPLVNGTLPMAQTNYRLGVYGGLIVAQIVTLLFGSFAIAVGCVMASRVLHSAILTRLLRAPMAFFDTTPLGRVMNRISKDMDYLDVNIPMILRQWFFAFLPLVSTVVLISYSTPVFLAAAVPLGGIFFFVQKLYIATARQLRRIDSIKRSPLFIHFDETIVGASSIRAYKRQHEFVDRCDALIDDSQRAWYLVLISQRWLGVAMETMGAFVCFAAAIFAVMQKDSIGAGLAGMSISYSLQVCIFLNVYIRATADLETYMVAVERIQEYSAIDTEASWENELAYPGDRWPDQGSVDYKEYSTRYRPGLDLVLKNVTFSVSPGEKIGVVGRTGAGKSSMALSLFRIVEAAGGEIWIDGVNVARLGLKDLRSRLTIIPQDPVIFSGSLRLNLDPFGLYTDAAVWEALRFAHLSSFVEALPQGLEYECGENGEALSVGQRQLVCLARALLRKTKILVLDEATAAVDLETDELIQTTIRTAFKDCTIITIAHRINTILDYDRVMVMSAGKIEEFEAPGKLLENTTSLFYSLAKDAGLVGK